MLPSGHPVIAPVGELDLATVRALDDILTSAARLSVHLTVDLSSVQFLDTSVLTVLLRAHRRASRRGGGLVLVGVAPLIRRLMAITGVDDELAVHDSPDEAVVAWQTRAQLGDQRRARGTHRRSRRTVRRPAAL
ncbi:MAG TPA: STAS domain-containing protein [Nocardioidaceae bacterium]|nr:STAS domain-containing protein [Nocardioidaceae bacterium]